MSDDINKSDNPIDMETVRENVLQRILDKLKLADDLKLTIERLAAHADKDSLLNAGRRNIKGDVNNMIGIVELLEHTVRSDIWDDIKQFGFLFARDVIAQTVREQGVEPVVFLTGNRFMPPFRSFDEIEAVWQADEEGEYVVAIWECVEKCCDQNEIFIGQPEHDNAIYGVDLRKWEHNEDSIGDDMNAEWQRIQR